MISSKSIIINRQSFINFKNIDIDIKISNDYPCNYINNDYKILLNNIKNEVCNYGVIGMYI